MSKLVANGMFNVTAAAEKGAKPQFVYWDECPSSFKFCAGKDGEEVYHIVYNTRNTASSKYSKIPYLCIVSHTKNSTYPSDDVANSVNPKWMNFQTMALFATDLMLARKILAEEIDVDSLTVRNVSAVSSDGKTTCTIDGETGKLTAKNAEFKDANVSGSLTVTRMSFINKDTYYLKQMSYMLGASGYYFAQQLASGELQKIDVFAVPTTKTIATIDIQSDGKCYIAMYVDGEKIGSMNTGETSVNFISGFNYSGYIIGLGYDTYTEWDIILHT